MSNNLETNKLAAAVIVAALIAMIVGTVARVIYGNGEEHGEKAEEKRGYKVEVAEVTAQNGVVAPVEVKIDVAALMAAANAENGKKVAGNCVSCHSFEKGEPHKMGPNLYGIIGNKFAHADNFNYSIAFKNLQGGWDYDSLFEFIKKPNRYVKGTKMTFAGLKKPEDIADLLAYLRTLSDKPLPLPQPEEVKNNSQ